MLNSLVMNTLTLLDWLFHEVMQRTLCLVPGWVTAMLDLIKDSANATFGGRGGMRDDTPSYPDPGSREVSLVDLHRLLP